MSKKPVQNLVCYLFKSGVADFNNLFKIVDGKSLKRNFKKIEKVDSIEFEMEGYLQKNPPKPPKWLQKLSTIFKLTDSIKNTSNSFVFFVKAENRIFAYTMGHAHHALDKSKIEYDFGLKVTLNEVDHSNIRGLDVRKLTSTSHQKREISSSNSILRDFEFDHNEEFINSLAGRATDKTIANSLVGKESLKLSVELDMSNIHEYSKKLLESYNKTDYQERFDFIDKLKPIKDPSIIALMKQKATESFQRSDLSKIVLAYPNIEDFDFRRYGIKYEDKIAHSDDLDTDILFNFIRDTDIDLSSICLDKFSIVLIDDESRIIQRYDIWDYLVFEFIENDKKYLYSANQLFEIDQNYFQSIIDEIRLYETDSINGINIPEFNHDDEGTYNIAFAANNTHNCVCLDKNNFRDFPNRPNDQVEVCDLITSNKEFICVKIYKKSSAPISHLFMQGIVSAELLIEVKDFREKINDATSHLFGDNFIDLDRPNRAEINYIYAIVMKKAGLLSDNLPFFSKISLRQSIKNLERMGFKVNLLKIQSQ